MITGQLVEQGTGQVFSLGFEPLSMGRGLDNTIVLADPQVSRHHAEVAMQGGRWVIRDLGSANGTYVNNQQIIYPQVLDHDDLIRVGQSTFRVELSVPLTDQDTLVGQRAPAAAMTATAPAAARTGVPWSVVILAMIALVAVALVFVLAVLPRLRGDIAGAPSPAVPQDTPIAGGGTPVDSGPSPTATLPLGTPTQTPIPTIPPPTPEPTQPLPTSTPLPTPTDVPAPEVVIGFFRADQTTVERGQCARLEWGGVENATEVTLTGVGQVGASGKLDVCLDATRDYVLKATAPGGTTQKTIRISVLAPINPIIDYFRVVPSIISPGDCAQLEWGKVENANTATIDQGIGGVGTPGNLRVCPGGTTIYVLTAQNPEGISTAQATLNVSTGADPKPVIGFFTANPSSIQAGECTTLNWGKVDYATSVTIDNNIGGVPTPGSQEVCLGATTIFLMTATGPGGTAESRLTIAVSPGQLANLPDLVLESTLFEPNPCYRGQKCKVRIKVRNDGPVAAEHFVVRWAPAGEEGVPVEWDVDLLAGGQETELIYSWIPNRADEKWWTLAIVDLNDEITEIEEGAANILEQPITVLEP